MKFSSKSLCVLALCIVLLLFFGCTQIQSDKSTLDSFSKLRTDYSAINSLPTNNLKLNDYISKLASLSANSSGSANKVIVAELNSAEAFYYLNEALSTSAGIDLENASCSSKSVKKAIVSINLADEFHSKAISALNGLSDNEKSVLRAGQIDAVTGYGESISQIKDFFDKKC